MEKIRKDGLRKKKFAVVLETAPLNAAELAEYCRRKGLYPEQVAAWRAACMGANANAAEHAREQRQHSKEDKRRIKQLEKELQRKEKALAEAAALLVLRKKVQAHKHSGLKFVTPAQRHNGVANAVLAQREIVYALAKASNPRRWSCSTRNSELKNEVWLNPERVPRAELKQCA